MGVDDSTQPLTIYNMVSSLLTIKIFLEVILLPVIKKREETYIPKVLYSEGSMFRTICF